MLTSWLKSVSGCIGCYLDVMYSCPENETCKQILVDNVVAGVCDCETNFTRQNEHCVPQAPIPSTSTPHTHTETPAQDHFNSTASMYIFYQSIS